MASVASRLPGIFALQPLNERESEAFFSFRLQTAGAPEDLFDPDALALTSAHCRGNRRQIMNMASLIMDEAYFREEKTIGSNLIFESDLFNVAE